jgi:hypothetical protein
MKLISPVLVPINVSILKTFRILENHNVSVDILENYNYQQIHYKLLMKYIDSNLLNECIRQLVWETHLGESDNVELEQLVEEINTSIYKEYYLYFLCNYIRDNNDYGGLMDFWRWLQVQHKFIFKKTFIPQLVTNLKTYNTILIPELWRNNYQGNLFNRIHKQEANYFDQFDMIKKSVKHLTDGGKIVLLNKRDYSWVLNNIGDDFKEVDSLVFQKYSPKPISKTKVKLWL